MGNRVGNPPRAQLNLKRFDRRLRLALAGAWYIQQPLGCN